MYINVTDYQAKQYYFHKYFSNTYYRIYITLEDLISSQIFRNDHSRVFLASPEYAFRRRFELTDTNHEDYDNVQVSSLHFPFASYWPLNSGWQADTRIAANTAAQVYRGMYVGNTLIKTASVVMNIPIQFYFDREDDARLAYETLLFKTFNPHYYSNTVAYGSNSIDIPIVVTIKDLQFNPQFKESDWLKQNRIFVLTANFEVRSYIINSGEQPDYDVSVNDSGYLIDSDGNVIVDESGQPVEYTAGVSNYYIVNNVLLNFNSFNWEYHTYYGDSEDSKPDVDDPKVGVIYVNCYNSSVNDINWYTWTQRKGFLKETNLDRFDENYKFIKFDSSYINDLSIERVQSGNWKGFPLHPTTNTVYIDTFCNKRDKKVYYVNRQWIWNPYSNQFERYESEKLDANVIDVFGKITFNTTRIEFLETISTSTTAEIKWAYISQSHDIMTIKVRKSGEAEWKTINSNSTSYQIYDLNSESEYTYEFEFYFSGDTSSETSSINKTITFITKNVNDTEFTTNTSLIGVKW